MEINKENIEITTIGETEVVVENIQQDLTNSVPKLTEWEQKIVDMVHCCTRTAGMVAAINNIPVEQVQEILSKA